jgi:hypothetical protein
MHLFTRYTTKLFTLLLCMGSTTLLNTVHAQKPLPTHAFQFMGGYSNHGSGDMKGIVFGTDYIKYLAPKFSLAYNLRGSINSSKHTIIVNNIDWGTSHDASIRFTTAGVQLGINGRLSAVRNSRHELAVSLGAFGRYQSASNGSDGYSLYNPLTTGVPTMLVGYQNSTPQETIALGGLLQLEYNYTIKNKVYIGLLPAFQTDTNGDVLPQLSVSVGRRL